MPKLADRPRSATYTRPWMADYQLDAVFCLERYAIVEASTKSGKTAACLVWLLEQAMQGRQGWNYWWTAPVYSQAEIAYSRTKMGIPASLYEANETQLRLTLANGAALWFKSAEKPDNLYGEDVYAAVIDEASRCREEAWHAVRSTLTATRGPIRIIGNVKGRKNWAYKLARRAESGEPGMHYARITAADAVKAGVLDQEEIDDARATLPATVFQELYEAEPTDDEGNPFGIAAIRACIEPAHSQCVPRVWGWDLARATDWTWGIGLCSHGRVARSERWNQSQLPSTQIDGRLPGSSSPAYWAVTLRRVQDLTGSAPALVDSTGPGGPIDQALALNGHRNIEGYVFTQRSKQLLMEGLAVAIQSREIGYPEGPLVTELEAFEYEYTRTGVRYSAPEGMHDDGVCALALAWQKFSANRVSHEMAVSMAGMARQPMPITRQATAPESDRAAAYRRLMMGRG
jgi:hypothetical protein